MLFLKLVYQFQKYLRYVMNNKFHSQVGLENTLYDTLVGHFGQISIVKAQFNPSFPNLFHYGNQTSCWANVFDEQLSGKQFFMNSFGRNMVVPLTSVIIRNWTLLFYLSHFTKRESLIALCNFNVLMLSVPLSY